MQIDLDTIDEHWTDVYDRHPFLGPVVYGHQPWPAPRSTAHTLGIDTGCVFGGSLTAVLFGDGPAKVLSVQAKRKYAEPYEI